MTRKSTRKHNEVFRRSSYNLSKRRSTVKHTECQSGDLISAFVFPVQLITVALFSNFNVAI